MIFHVSAPKGLLVSTTLLSFLVSHTPLSRALVRQLIDIGAVYLRVGAPHPRVSPRAKRVEPGNGEVELPVGEPIYGRVYANPKRHFPRTAFSVVDELEEFVVVCKPAGLPVAASVDNTKDCVLNLIRERTAKEAFVTSRLDVGTSGVLIVAKKREAVRQINDMLSTCRKRYLVWTHNKPPGGLWCDWYNRRASLRRHSVDCVLKQQLESADAGFVSVELCVESVSWCEQRACWESLVTLITGKTHQIRVQFAARRCPVVGDVKYAGMQNGVIEGGLGPDAEWLGLHCVDIEGKWKGDLVNFRAGKECRGLQDPLFETSIVRSP